LTPGIVDQRQGPFSATQFAVGNLYRAHVGNRWLFVFAGATKAPDGQAQQSALDRSRIAAVTEPLVHRPLRIGVVVLLLLGVGLAATGVVAAMTHGEPAQGWAFVAVGVVLAGAAGLVARGVRWVIVVCFVALAGQLAAVVGTVAELVFGVAEVRQRQLRGLGFDPATAVAVNLVWSALGFGLFCWLAVRWWARRRRGRGAT
jgi:hypothetical protein